MWLSPKNNLIPDVDKRLVIFSLANTLLTLTTNLFPDRRFSTDHESVECLLQILSALQGVWKLAPFCLGEHARAILSAEDD